MLSSVVWKRPLPANSWISEKGGHWCEGKRAKISVGKANGWPGRKFRVAA